MTTTTAVYHDTTPGSGRGGRRGMDGQVKGQMELDEYLKEINRENFDILDYPHGQHECSSKGYAQIQDRA